MSQQDAAFENAAKIPGGELYFARWVQEAADFRRKVQFEDVGGNIVFLPGGRPKGLMIFVHGGYWIKTDPSVWSHLAGGAIARGWAVGMPGYTRAPDARITRMVAEVGQGIEALAQRIAGPITLTGHSAGGHLVARMICKDSPLPSSVLDRIQLCAPISGLFDLAPLMQTSMNQLLRLDADEARAQSPIHSLPLPDQRLLLWVGGQERPEFLRQTRALAQAWAELLPLETVEEPGRHHFDVIEALTDAKHPLLHRLTQGS